MTPAPFEVGDPIIVLGRICSVSTCVGLFGYISNVWPEDGGKLTVRLLRHPTLEDRSDIAAEKAGRFESSCYTALPGDLRRLTDSESLSRVAAFKLQQQAKDDRPSPAVTAIMERFASEEGRRTMREDREAVEAENKRIGQVFTLPGAIKRGNKSNFPAFSDPTIQENSSELRGYAAAGPKNCTLEQRARWTQCLEATDSASFWSGQQEVRDLVRELDLDPMTDGHSSALWCRRGSVYAKVGDLRNAVIKLWNTGAVIHKIQDMDSEDSSWSTYKGGEPNGFLIDFGFRRELPV